MRTKRLSAAIAATVTLLAASSAAAATTYTVCPAGCDSMTIQGGIDLAGAGDTVSVSAGTYNENVNLNKAITLDGSGNTTVVQPTASGPAISITVSGSPSTPVTVSDLKTTGASGGGNTGSGITIATGATDVTIASVESSGNSGHG